MACYPAMSQGDFNLKGGMMKTYPATEKEMRLAAEDYQRTFELPIHRDAKLGDIKPRTNYPGVFEFELIGTGAKIFVNPNTRRAYTDFVEGAGVDF